ncbi:MULTISPECIES: glycoside hydrolase family 97 N-terminal domain-containing protein [unclassified Colwellia]|uniref:glycoside hydrolase family 97 N-terminal domain-containing protein n=1 Tax=unclassified Colwellia TaxID=196834 RepID=UPI0015F5C85F|nr:MULTISPECIES: glycoside hydrolase family 97 N-terminal domain-containing protein [unclassified Colwellia]MBA6231828.1 glycoside hydrolase family 97 N-terminal domain-containing protein [Colwellia sp. MB02u-7]MBA6235783.1 glycoside hydrolase family 97 N-terminal domain-containing protein [Colwellia sp. MB02u-11]MBA6254972.1 glycoside hydrolase family 97 N-terminal domain-containing protein [Colwellia sp. MB3u-28]MBA6259077.1 glycoside hydrolase family 97 N-terminal domain-containing protein [
MLCLIILLSFPTLFAQTVKVSSPDVKIVLSVNDNRKPNYAINFIGGSIIKPSCWGLAFKNTIVFSDGFILYAHQEKSANKVWQLPWG